jgi:hypothetical protein
MQLRIRQITKYTHEKLPGLEGQLLCPATIISSFLALQKLGKIDNESTK